MSIANITAEFEKDINDPLKSAIFDLSYHGRPILIAFGGIYGALGIPPFEFFKLTKNLDVNKIYLRDLSQTWYHSGLYGVSENIEDTASFLKSKINESGAKKVVVLGNSMGGYAAILFGVLIKADIIHAFSPQTFLNNAGYFKNKNKLQNVYDKFSNKYFDLKELIKFQNYSAEINLYFDSKDSFDNYHAIYLHSIQNVKLHSFRKGGHGLIRILKRTGRLQKIIELSFNNELIKNTKSKKHHSFLAKFFGINW